MDPATLIGVIFGLVIIVAANVMEGGNPMSLLLLPPMLLATSAALRLALEVTASIKSLGTEAGRA